MAEHKALVLTAASPPSEGDIVRWNGTAWVPYADTSYAGQSTIQSIPHSGKRETFAGNTSKGQSKPSFVKYAESSAVAGTRTSDVIFTRTAGTWVVDALIGQYVYSYANADPDAGSWLPITDNDATTLTVDGVLYAACDRVKTCMWNPLKDFFAHGAWPESNFQGMLWDGKYIWLIPRYALNIYKVNPVTGERTGYAHGQGSVAFADAVFDGEFIWMVPDNATSVVKVAVIDGSMTAYSIAGFVSATSAFRGGIFDGENVWLVPYRHDSLVKVNPSTGAMTEYAHGKGDYAFSGGVFDGESLWLVPYSSDDLVKVDPSDGSMTDYDMSATPSTFNGGVFDGRYVWLIPSSDDQLVRVDPSTGTMTAYSHGYGSDAFNGGVFDGESLWLTPSDSDSIVKVNPLDASMVGYSHGQSTLFNGCLFDGECLWFCHGNGLYRTIPPRFGQPSLHTSGPIFAQEAVIGNNVSSTVISEDGVIKLPYLAAAPSVPANGMIWMESDGLHLYYGGAEKTVAGS